MNAQRSRTGDSPAHEGANDDHADFLSDDTLWLVDGSGFIFRAYFALPQNLTNPEGTPVGAVLGFTNMLLKLLSEFKAPYIAVVFDAARKNFRNDIYADYKANREEPPEDLKPQFGLIREATEAFGIAPLELEGYEADDLIATYARMARERGQKVVIVGSDKDMYQLIDDHVRMYDPIKQKFIGPEDVQDKFGVEPEKVIDVQALSGDAIDNVPGVPGIGPKTAAQLINEYGSLENLLDNLDQITQPKRREMLEDHADDARTSKKLVRLEDEVDVPLKPEDLEAHDPTSPELAAFLKKQGFKSLISRLSSHYGIDDGNMEDNDGGAGTGMADEAGQNLPPIADNDYVLIQDSAALKAFIEEAYEKGVVAIDTETTHLTPARAELVGISLACRPGRAAYIPLGHVHAAADLLDEPRDQPTQLEPEDAAEILKPVLEDPAILKIGHNIKYDMQIISAMGIEMGPVDDTMLLSYVLDSTEHGHGMDELARLNFDHETIKYKDIAGTGKNQLRFDQVAIDQALDYAAEDAEITLRLHKVLKPRIGAEHMARLYEDIERPLVPVIAKMEQTGILVDTGVLNDMSRDFGQKLGELETEIHRLSGHEFNVGSPKQLGKVLFDEMGLRGGKKTKTGDWSTSADLLESLAAEGHEIVDKVLEWRQLAKLKSTYTDALPHNISPVTGRVHTSFSLAGTSTGRLASSEPNLQNIPIRTEEGRKIRTAFIAGEGAQILSVDYSQVELRLVAEMAGIEALREAFANGRDIHATTASRVFDVPMDEMTPEIRRQAKAINFGIIYGISGWGLAKQLGCSAAEANSYIQQYFTRFPELGDFMEATKEDARQHGFVRTLFGRKCTISGINDKTPTRRSAAERQAINAPVQGTAADIMKLAMTAVPGVLEEAGSRARLLLQVHDELLLEVPEDELEDTAELVRGAMENVVKRHLPDFTVPFVAEAGWGPSWAEAH